MLKIGGVEVESRMLLGTALYPSPDALQNAISQSETQIVTASIRRQNPEEKGGEQFWEILKQCNVNILPNTAGSRSAKQAIDTACLARAIFETNWIKLEVIGNEYSLHPDPFELVVAAKELVTQGFEVFPYTTSDIVVAERLIDAGCKIVMPLASPIGSGQGISDIRALLALRARFPEITLVVDAGIGRPSHAAQAMEIGYDAVLLNSAVALSRDPASMARAFKLAIQAGREAYLAGIMEQRDFARPTTPTVGIPFWHQKNRGKVTW